MKQPVFVIPGIGNSGPAHWQSLWQAAHPSWQRLVVADWDEVECRAWVAALQQQLSVINAAGPAPLLVAHSLGCLALAHWASQASPASNGGHGRIAIQAALLVAVPDPQSAAFPAAARGFDPVPLAPLPFPSIVVASTDDPYGSVDHARRCADGWGSEFVVMGAHGHLNAQSGLGEWPQGWRLLQQLAS